MIIYPAMACLEIVRRLYEDYATRVGYENLGDDDFELVWSAAFYYRVA